MHANTLIVTSARMKNKRKGVVQVNPDWKDSFPFIRGLNMRHAITIAFIAFLPKLVKLCHEVIGTFSLLVFAQYYHHIVLDCINNIFQELRASPICSYLDKPL